MSSLRTTTCDALFVRSENRVPVMFFWSQPFKNFSRYGEFAMPLTLLISFRRVYILQRKKFV